MFFGEKKIEKYSQLFSKIFSQIFFDFNMADFTWF